MPALVAVTCARVATVRDASEGIAIDVTRTALDFIHALALAKPTNADALVNRRARMIENKRCDERN